MKRLTLQTLHRSLVTPLLAPVALISVLVVSWSWAGSIPAKSD